MTDPALSLLGQALGITNFLETALKRRTVCIAGTLEMNRRQGRSIMIRLSYNFKNYDIALAYIIKQENR